MTAPLFTAFVVCATCLVTSPASAQGNRDDVTKVLDQWKKRQGGMKAVRYTVVGTVEVFATEPKTELLLPVAPKERPYRAVVLIDILNNKHRIDATERALSLDRLRWVDRVTINAYNGETYQTAIPRHLNDRSADDPDIFVSSGNLSQKRVDSIFWPIFSAHGFIPTVTCPLRVDRLPASHVAEEFTSRGRVGVNGETCLVLRSTPLDAETALTDELSVSQAMDGAVLRHTYFNGKNPWTRVDVSYRKSDRGWFPVSWSDVWTANGKVQRIHRRQVTSVEVDPFLKESDFSLPIEKGMIVYSDATPYAGSGLDPDKPAVKKYTAGESRTIEERGATTVAGLELEPTGRELPTWVWWSIAFLTAVAGGYAFYRRRQRQSSV